MHAADEAVAATAFAQLLSALGVHPRSLAHLDLSENRLGDTGTLKVLHSLGPTAGSGGDGLACHFPALETLDLRYNALSRAGALAVQRALTAAEPRRFLRTTDAPQLLTLRAVD